MLANNGIIDKNLDRYQKTAKSQDGHAGGKTIQNSSMRSPSRFYPFPLISNLLIVAVK